MKEKTGKRREKGQNKPGFGTYRQPPAVSSQGPAFPEMHWDRMVAGLGARLVAAAELASGN